jgi:hypothetical protein
MSQTGGEESITGNSSKAKIRIFPGFGQSDSLRDKNQANSRGHEPNRGVTSHRGSQVVTMGFDTKTFGWYPQMDGTKPPVMGSITRGTPIAGCFIMDNNPNLKWIISGYPHFTKPLSVYVCQARWHFQAQKNQSAVGFLELVRTFIRVIPSPQY